VVGYRENKPKAGVCDLRQTNQFRQQRIRSATRGERQGLANLQGLREPVTLQFMRRVVTTAALVAVTVAACARSQPAALDASPPPAPDAPPSAGSIPQAPAAIAQAPMSQQVCSQQLAAEIVRAQRTLQASNDPCVVYWRSFDVRQHPERAFYLECDGLKAYPDPQQPGHPVSLAECDRKLRERQAQMGVPVGGMTDEQKATYRATWGGG